ncbi:hypothetical protein E2R51_13995 [Jeotgalibacillus sp. S-D1]|uniref:hypothetical protein n=1 Tax=Jeotgalibacillus sp. S-D1 TaxID=2552189 RepID=UPI00105993C5|nr:hypothetical protein [Jeotgalibacillus sp. S-D1]TDL31472.1 hypothetical protein E2R51_13995 [Jeotgalibacillus sp. S-D1]
MEKEPRNKPEYDEEFAEEVIQRQIQEVYEVGSMDERGAQIDTSSKTGSVKGNKKTDGPNYPAT